MTNVANSKAEILQDTTTVCEKDHPQYNMRDFDIKKLAELLAEEKKAGVANYSTFADFFRNCGMKYGEFPKEYKGYLEYHYHVMKGYYKIYSGQKAFIKAISIYEKSEDGKNHHSIGIAFPDEDTNRLQWMTVQLRAFGMKDVRSEAVKLEGKGLHGFGMRGFFEIRY